VNVVHERIVKPQTAEHVEMHLTRLLSQQDEALGKMGCAV
jgi:hypothetical protein